MKTIINGKKIAEKIRTRIKKEIAARKIKPGLAVILIGKNPASKIYVRLKEKACAEAGIYFEKYLLPEKISSRKAIDLIETLNRKKKINGILVQFPLPRHLDADKIVLAIDPKKDVDGFHPENIKNLFAGKPCLVSPVLSGVMELIKSTGLNFRNKKALIVSNSETFARPLAKLLENKKILPNIYLMPKHGRQETRNALKRISLQADILIVAVGRPKFIRAAMVKKNAVVIDVGYNMVKGKSIGDADFESVAKKAAFITPVPGGVGPMTVAMLLKNVVRTRE